MVVNKSPEPRESPVEMGSKVHHADPRTTSPLRRKGRGALMAAAAAEQKGIVDAGGEVSDQFTNWRNVKCRVRAGGKLATMALELQQTLGSPLDLSTATPHPSESRTKRSAEAAGMGFPTREGTKRRAGTNPIIGTTSALSPTREGTKTRAGATPTKAARCQHRKPLPPKYAQLEALFRSLEGVCSLLALRKKPCTYENVKKPLEDMTGRRFSLCNLSQLVGVYPEAFLLHYESSRRASTVVAAPGLLFSAPTSPPRAKWDLRIDLQPIASIAERSLEETTDASRTAEDGQTVGPQEHSRRRVQGFRERLERAAEAAHRTFLDERGLGDPGGWHPGFDLNQVPDIPCAPLPSLPRSRLITSSERNPLTASNNVTANGSRSQTSQKPSPASSRRFVPSVNLPSSPSSPLKTRPAVGIGSPSALKIGSPRPATPRSLARTFESVAEAPASADSAGISQRGGGFERVPRGGPGEAGVASRRRNNLLRVQSVSEKGFESGLDSGLVSSSETDSDCCMVASGMGDVSPNSPTVWLREGAAAGGKGGRVAAAAAAGLRGVPLDIVQQLAAREKRAQVEGNPAAVAGRQRRNLLGQLPGLVNQLRAVAAAEGRCVLRKEQLLTHLVKGNPRTVDHGELTAQLNLLQELAPGFLSTPSSTAATTSLVRINVKADFAALKKTLARAT